jgi:tetratricopeptide (TPR) repeat protein
VTHSISNSLNYDQALEIHKSVLETKIRVCGQDSLSVAASFNNLGEVYRHQALYEEALEMFAKSLDIKTRILGGDSQSVADSINNVGNVNNTLGQHEKALKYYQKSLDIHIRVVGGATTRASPPHTKIWLLCTCVRETKYRQKRWPLT